MLPTKRLSGKGNKNILKHIEQVNTTNNIK